VKTGIVYFSKAALLLTVAFLVGCDSTSYNGDGTLTYNGLSAAVDQYELELGVVNQGQYSFRLSGLPNETFTLGLGITTTLDSASFCDDLPLSNFVSMRLTTLEGEVIIDESAPLKNWTWNTRTNNCNLKSFGYRRGKSEEDDLGDGLTTNRPIDVKAHEGWGSYFTAKSDTDYILQVSVRERLPDGFVAKIEASGGGWK